MARSRSLQKLTVAALAILAASCSSNNPQGGGSGGSGPRAGDATGGATTASTGGTPGGTAPSCSGLAATCGPSGTDDCCKSLLVPGGTFYRSYDGVDNTDKSYPATVADFYLDRYEITVGRFRTFVNAGMGTQASPPAASAGAHPLITGSGWDSTWNTNLAADPNSLNTAMSSVVVTGSCDAYAHGRAAHLDSGARGQVPAHTDL